MVMQLTKDSGEIDIKLITALTVGAAWDDSTAMQGRVKGWLNRQQGADLDLIVVAFQNDEPVRYAGFDNVDPFKNGSVRHSGDAKVGRKNEGDDETVDITFANIPPAMNIHKFVIFVSAFKPGKSFDAAANIAFNVYDRSGDGRAELVASIAPSLRQSGNAHRVCTIERKTQGWVMRVDDVRGNITQGNVQSLYAYACQ